MKRIGTFALIVGTAALTLAVPSGISAQTQSGAPAVREQARVDELVKYAREKFAEGQVQPAQGQQKTLEERAEARPVVRLTVAQAVQMAIDNNIELSVERLNPQLQDLTLAQTRGAYRPTLNSTVNANSSMPLPTSLLNGGKPGDQRNGERERQHRPDPALVRHELHGGVQQRAHEHDQHVRHAEPAVHDAAHRHDHAAAAAGLQDRQHAATSC